MLPRVRAPLRLNVPGFDEPIRGLALSIPDGRQPLLNRLHLLAGSLPEAGRADQAVVSDAFARAHRLQPDDTVVAIINGRYARLQISGIARSPEVIYQAAPTDLLPDYLRYATLWLNERALAQAFGMDGAFNQLLVSVQPGADVASVSDRLDGLLDRYGTTGTQTRHDQQSHRFLEEELSQQRAQATILPAIFLTVSAFLLHVVMGRIILTQREPLAMLKAFGYRNRELALHYGLLAGLITALGWALGVVLGAWAASGLAGLYADYFRFPAMPFRVPPGRWRSPFSSPAWPPWQAPGKRCGAPYESRRPRQCAHLPPSTSSAPGSSARGPARCSATRRASCCATCCATRAKLCSRPSASPCPPACC